MVDGTHLAVGEAIGTGLFGEGAVGAHVVAVAMVLVFVGEDSLVRTTLAKHMLE